MRRFYGFFLNNQFVLYLLIAVLPFIVFYKATLGTDVFVLGDFSGSDLLEMHLPFKYILHDAYTSGRIPLWTSALSNGFPVFAEGQSGALYPIHVLLAFLPAVIALNYSILISFSIAGIGAFLYAKTLPRMTIFGALSVAVVFMFCSFFIARLKHLNMIVVAAYLPISLYCIKRALNDSRVNFNWFVMLGIVWAIQLLAGHPHMFFLCALMCAWYAYGEVFRIYFKCQKKSDILVSVGLATLCGLLLSSFVGIGIAAVQLLPTYELTNLSNRPNYTYQVATDYPLKPNFLVSLFAPFFLGNPATGAYPNTKESIHDVGIWWENVLYVGLLPFVLIIIMFGFEIRKLVKNRGVKLNREFDEHKYYYWFFFISIIVFFILSTGDYTPLFSVVYENVPGMRLFRFPTRFNLLTLFLISVMSGWALSRLVERLERSRVVGDTKKEESSDYVFSWPFPKKITYAIFLGILTVDLTVFAYQYISFYPIRSYLSTPESVLILKKDQSMYRIYPTTQYSQNPFGVMGWKTGQKAIESLQAGIPGNFAAVYGLGSFSDRGWFEGGFGVKERIDLENILTKSEISSELLGKIVGLWNVKYIIGFSPIDERYFNKTAEYALGEAFGLPLNIWENKNVMPRAYLTSELTKSSDTDDTIKRLFNSRFDPYFSAISESEGVESTTSAEFDSREFVAKNNVSIVSYEDEKVLMKSNSEKDSYLVFSDTYYPGWKAYVDGQNTPIISVNMVQRAVRLEKGEHTILWVYQPMMFMLGAGISFATCLTILCGVAFRLKRRGVANR